MEYSKQEVWPGRVRINAHPTARYAIESLARKPHPFSREATMAYAEFTEQKVRHLEMLQAVITRLASQSANVKIATVLLGAVAISGVASAGSLVAGLLALIFTALFGLLDAYYLREERRYRRLYNDILIGKEEVEAFQMSLSESQRESETLKSAVQSWSIWPFYGGILVLIMASITL